MKGSQGQEPQERRYWHTASELPQEVFAVLRKRNRAINPIAIVATVDPDGTPLLHPLAVYVRSHPDCCGWFPGTPTTPTLISATTGA